MKTVIASALLLSLSTLSFAAEKTKSPNETIRRSIDNHCGDTWCEGDFKYSFTSVKIEKDLNQFTVNFVMTPYVDEAVTLDDESVTAYLKPATSVKCVVKGYSDASLIVTSFGGLSEGVSEALNKCINSLEQKIYSKM